MKKANVIVTVIAVVLSVFLLWLWYFLGFNKVDNPLDLVLTIIWWALIVVMVLAIRKVEQTRQEKIRTCYVAPAAVFNSEKGSVALQGKTPVDALEELLGDLEYNFDSQDVSDEEKAAIAYVVRSSEFKPGDQDQDKEPTWKGEVAVVAKPDDGPIKFGCKEELAQILATA